MEKKNNEYIYYKYDNADCILAKHEYNDFIRKYHKNKHIYSEKTLQMIKNNLSKNVNRFCK